MEATHSITYNVLSQDALDRLISDAAIPDRLLSESSVLNQFDICRSYLMQLVNEGLVTRYAIPGRAKTMRYSEKQIKSIFKPL